MLKQEELLWYQKARVEWIQDGDKNTTFFHLSTIARRWRNKISAIRECVDGEWIHDKVVVQEHFVKFFQQLFTHYEEAIQADLPSDFFQEFTSRDWDFSSCPFSKCEIEKVIKDMGALKAPGPDGF